MKVGQAVLLDGEMWIIKSFQESELTLRHPDGGCIQADKSEVTEV